jgi:hypothetical protein
MKGGILSAINKEGEGLTWVRQTSIPWYLGTYLLLKLQRYCMSASPAETRELLQNIGKHHDILGVTKPMAVIVNNCCQVRRYVVEGLGPGTDMVLDVYHFMMWFVTHTVLNQPSLQPIYL